MPAPVIPPLAPTREEFHALSAGGNLVPVWAELPADLDTPLSAYLRLRSGAYSFLLESVEGGEKWARYSFIGTDPVAVLTATGRRLVLKRRGRPAETLRESNPIAALRELMREFRPVPVPGLPRFQGGAVGYLGWDAVRHLERLPMRARDNLDSQLGDLAGLPEAVFMLTDTLLAFDNLRHRLLVIANAHVNDRSQAALDRAYDDAAVRIGMAIARLGRASRPPAAPRLGDVESLVALGESGFSSSLDERAFAAAVVTAKAHIAAGDAFQIVLSRRLECPLGADPFSVYRALRTINPSPYLFFLRLGPTTIVGSSPEVLVRVEAGRVEVRPIAGTRPRGRTPAEDARIEEELRADPKERAEHVMLVDLGRNDVGRVARLGSVGVTELMGTERYSHVMHLVSHVTGELRPDLDALGALAACFPAGTVSGAPKIRAMEIIDALEPTGRGPYAGAVGYLSYSGSLDSCITIRTIVCHRGRASVQVGAGIVADSDPKAEWLETGSKARGLVLALRMAAATARA